MSNLNFSPKSISRFDFEEVAVGLTDSVFNFDKDEPFEPEQPSLERKAGYMANTRILDLAFKVK